MPRGSLSPFATTCTLNPGATEGAACCGAMEELHVDAVVCALVVSTTDQAANKYFSPIIWLCSDDVRIAVWNELVQ
jgi:hypothetical protein